MRAQPINNNGVLLIAKGNQSGSFGDFCAAKYNATFRVNSLQDEEGHMQGESLLKFAKRPDVVRLRKDVTNAQFRKNAYMKRQDYSALFTQQNIINDKTAKLNKIIEEKKEELLKFKMSCDLYLTEEQKAVIDEERQRLEKMKLPLAVSTNQLQNPHSTNKKPMTWQERETIKIHEDDRREIDRRKNHFPTTFPAILPYVAEWLLTH